MNTVARRDHLPNAVRNSDPQSCYDPLPGDPRLTVDQRSLHIQIFMQGLRKFFPNSESLTSYRHELRGLTPRLGYWVNLLSEYDGYRAHTRVCFAVRILWVVGLQHSCNPVVGANDNNTRTAMTESVPSRQNIVK